MNTFFNDIRETIVPDATSKHGPLPPLLLGLTLVTGLVDAFSYLVLGHVFVANMTGNVVFLGFALAGAPGFSISASIMALASFGVGALVGGGLGSQRRQHRGRLLATATTLQSVLLAGSVVLAALSGSPMQDSYTYALIIVLGGCMGIQNAAVRRLAVPDLTTTVLTLTITGIAADSVLAGGEGLMAGRRFLAVASMLVGALIGAAFVVHDLIVYPLVLAFAVTVIVAGTTRILGMSDPPWVRPGS